MIDEIAYSKVGLVKHKNKELSEIPSSVGACI
jgi:hypothetical protein